MEKVNEQLKRKKNNGIAFLLEVVLELLMLNERYL